MKTMKVIDLLNKIANGEKVPETIKLCRHKYQYYSKVKDYKAEDIEKYWLISDFLETCCDLIEEVEIIEDTPKEDKKIEHLKQNDYSYSTIGIMFGSKINEIIDKVNEMDDKHEL